MNSIKLEGFFLSLSKHLVAGTRSRPGYANCNMCFCITPHFLPICQILTRRPLPPPTHTHTSNLYCITLWVFLPARFKAVKEVQFYIQYLFDPISGLSGSNFKQLFCVLLKREGIQYDATLLKITIFVDRIIIYK